MRVAKLQWPLCTSPEFATLSQLASTIRFALLLAEEKELSEKEKAEILQSLFRTYVKLVKGLGEELGISKRSLEEIFREEMKA